MRIATLSVIVLLAGVCSALPQGQYGAPAQPKCETKRVQQPTSYNCKQDQECNTSYEEECQTIYDEECQTKYGEKCELEYQEKCETKYEEQCKTEYTEECQTKYDQQCKTEYDQQCDTKYEEKCETTYGTSCKTEYEQQCETSYEQQCETKYDTQYEEQCQTSYEEQCETKYETQYEQKCETKYDTQYEEQCQTTYEEQCQTKYETQYETKYEEKCETQYETQYETTYEEQCQTSYEQQCQTKYEEQCQTTYEQQCETKYETSYEQQCQTTYEQQCETKYETQYEEKCKTVYKTEYETTYEDKCETKYEDKCNTVYETQYETKYEQQCQTSYEQQCQTKYETSYEQQCQTKYETSYEQQCQTTYQQQCEKAKPTYGYGPPPVGASTMDRQFSSYASLGSGVNLKGESLSSRKIQENKFYPLINAMDAKLANQTDHDAQRCFQGSLDPRKAKGKIVACLRGTNARVEKGETVRVAGGLGMILANDESTGNEIIADAHVLPATHISYTKGLTLFSYLNSTKSPVAYISAPKTVFNTTPAPFMAAFSSQGPNVINPEIVKPDITAPGVSILAAFTGAAGPTKLPFDTRRVHFNSESGTSMSCPHIAGVVGLLKTIHPDWSSAAIKSAIMTTARTRDNTGTPVKDSSFVKANPFNYGSGHVRPNRAMDPGLVYDITTEDYLNFLCSLGYNSSTIANFSTMPYSCPSVLPKITDLNYPSIAVPDLSGKVTVTRRLKNVGSPGSYTVRVVPPAGVSMVVEPRSLEFYGVGDEKTFKVTLMLKGKRRGGEYVFGRMIWSDGVHYVRSPLVVKAS